MSAFYNEIERYPAQWLRNLMSAGHIAPGHVEERSIVDLKPEDLDGYRQAHFFAGIGVWSHALRTAGVPDDAPIWTGSCPCQPFSSAGKRQGATDSRHLWPAWFRLIRECRPPIIFGEQVASKDGLAWLAAVQADLEGEGYAFGAADLCAAGVGAPHIRQRLYFVAHSERWSAERRGLTVGAAPEGSKGTSQQRQRLRPDPGDGGNAGDLAHSRLDERAGRDRLRDGDAPAGDPRGQVRIRTGDDPGDSGPGFWSDLAWIPCRDGKARPTQPGLFPLAHGTPARVGRLRAYGNAIVAPLAAEFVRSALEAI